jgi:hypothetical protein
MPSLGGCSRAAPTLYVFRQIMHRFLGDDNAFASCQRLGGIDRGEDLVAPPLALDPQVETLLERVLGIL